MKIARATHSPLWWCLALALVGPGGCDTDADCFEGPVISFVDENGSLADLSGEYVLVLRLRDSDGQVAEETLVLSAAYFAGGLFDRRVYINGATVNIDAPDNKEANAEFVSISVESNGFRGAADINLVYTERNGCTFAFHEVIVSRSQ